MTVPVRAPVRKLTKAGLRRQAIAAWWARPPWPAVILAIDPGRQAGASILVSGPGGLELESSESVDLHDRAPRLELVVDHAAEVARSRDLPLVAMLEDWGRGGPRGLAQWIGLGEARGPWRRYLIRCTKIDVPLSRSRILLATQNRWRSLVVPQTGRVDAAGKWHAFGPDGWKEAAKDAATDYFVDTYVPPLDAAESACIGLYAARSDAVGRSLGVRHLKRHGLTFEPLEPLIFGTRKRKAEK